MAKLPSSYTITEKNLRDRARNRGLLSDERFKKLIAAHRRNLVQLRIGHISEGKPGKPAQYTADPDAVIAVIPESLRHEFNTHHCPILGELYEDGVRRVEVLNDTTIPQEQLARNITREKQKKKEGK